MEREGVSLNSFNIWNNSIIDMMYMLNMLLFESYKSSGTTKITDLMDQL